MTKLGIVVIGRNEGERLVNCLRALPADTVIVYVDSGSSDGSVAAATELGAQVLALDMSSPFTAARARNAGRAALPSSCAFIQFVDGDCTIQPGWLATARAALDNDPTLAAVFGRRREIRPEASRYNWLCDLEWAVPPGPVLYFGGDVMLRAAALDQAGGYPDEMIAGEEPDLALRLRARGWKLACLPAEMTRHDAAITRFSQWWRRMIRSGHAYAELAARHTDSAGSDYRKRLRGTLFWGVALPAAATILLAAAAINGSTVFAIAGGIFLLLPLAQLARLALRETRRLPFALALRLATFLMLGKPAQSIGIARFWLGRVRGRRSALIEYKGEAA